MKLFFRSTCCLIFATALPLLGLRLFPERAPEERTLTLLTADGAVRMSMDEYLVGVLAGEMPASFPEEALKAQAVASRSYAETLLRRGKHGANTLCAAGSCCQSWKNEEERRALWGSDFNLYEAKLRACAEATGLPMLFRLFQPQAPRLRGGHGGSASPLRRRANRSLLPRLQPGQYREQRGRVGQRPALSGGGQQSREL